MKVNLSFWACPNNGQLVAFHSECTAECAPKPASLVLCTGSFTRRCRGCCAPGACTPTSMASPRTMPFSTACTASWQRGSWRPWASPPSLCRCPSPRPPPQRCGALLWRSAAAGQAPRPGTCRQVGRERLRIEKGLPARGVASSARVQRKERMPDTILIAGAQLPVTVAGNGVRLTEPGRAGNQS